MPGSHLTTDEFPFLDGFAVKDRQVADTSARARAL